MEKKNLVVDKSIEVALIIIDSCDLMDTEKKIHHFTSIVKIRNNYRC